MVSQLNKLFNPSRVRLKAGQNLSVLNDDTRTHNMRINSPTLDYNSGAQEPKQTITIRFPDPGTYEAFCGIHPSMRSASRCSDRRAGTCPMMLQPLGSDGSISSARLALRSPPQRGAAAQR